MTRGIAAAIVRVAEAPAILGLGDLEVLRVLPSGLVLEGHSILYVVDVQLGPTDDRQVIRLVERWAAERRRRAGRRCFAILVAGQIETRYFNILRLISRAMPVVAMEMHIADGLARFTPVVLG